MKRPLRVKVNGTEYDRSVDVRSTLADFLREDLDLTGTHVGCEHGVCGACTVLLDGEPIRACLMLAVQANGRTITTIEGIGAPGDLHPVQRAFTECHGLQCGFCTPGMVLTALDLVRRRGRPSREEIRYALVGNLCRCTGYTKILDAVEEYAGQAAAEVPS